jgi:acyl transferase domain-containing protein
MNATGITVPNPDAQVRCIKKAYLDAGIGVDETVYVECHGTGTKAGDWRELKAVSEALCRNRQADNPILVGSVKPNIGHLEGGAGVAGLIKAILVAEKGLINPHINFENWNPDIKHREWKVDASFRFTFLISLLSLHGVRADFLIFSLLSSRSAS